MLNSCLVKLHGEKYRGKKNDKYTVVNFVLLYVIGRGGCNLVSGNVYGRVESARAVGECFQKLVSDPD